VVGILSPTGTPVDQTLHVSLASIEAIHEQTPHADHHEDHGHHEHDAHKEHQHPTLAPDSLTITAAMLGLNSKTSTFQIQRAINNYQDEPLTAILPGVALTELWQMMAVLEKTLLLVSALVFIAACLGLSAMLLSSIRERAREIQLLRVIGAPPYYLFLLIQVEALCITLCSLLLGIGLLWLSLHFLQPYLIDNLGLPMSTNLITSNHLVLVIAIIVVSMTATLIPATKAYLTALKQ